MDTQAFSSSNDGFRILGFHARFSFKTATSISFDVERVSKALGGVTQIGWIDVHHRCGDHIKARLRVCIPSEFHAFESMDVIRIKLFDVLKIPLDETYEADFFDAEDVSRIEQATDRDGFTDRIY